MHAITKFCINFKIMLSPYLMCNFICLNLKKALKYFLKQSKQKRSKILLICEISVLMSAQSCSLIIWVALIKVGATFKSHYFPVSLLIDKNVNLFSLKLRFLKFKRHKIFYLLSTKKNNDFWRKSRLSAISYIFVFAYT